MVRLAAEILFPYSLLWGFQVQEGYQEMRETINTEGGGSVRLLEEEWTESKGVEILWESLTAEEVVGVTYMSNRCSREKVRRMHTGHSQ